METPIAGSDSEKQMEHVEEDSVNMAMTGPVQLAQTHEPLTPRPPRNCKSVRSPRSKAKTQSIYRSPRFRTPDTSSPAIQKLKEKAMKLENLGPNITLDQYEELLYCLTEERKSLATNHKYREGARLNNAVEFVEQAFLKAKKTEMQKGSMETFEKGEKDFNDKFEDYDKKTEQMKKDLLDKQKRQRDTLNAVHQKELDDFDAHWKSPAKQRLYNRASPQLTSMRRQLAFMLVDCRFKDAEEVRAIVDRRTQFEEKENHMLMQHDFDEALKKLKAKQALETESFEEKAEVEREKLKQDRAKQRVGWENRAKKIAAKGEVVKDMDRLWNHEKNQRIANLSKTCASVAASLPSTKLTRKDIADQEMVVLTLPPLNNRRAAPKSRKSARE